MTAVTNLAQQRYSSQGHKCYCSGAGYICAFTGDAHKGSYPVKVIFNGTLPA